MVAPNPLAARRRTNSSSFSVAVPSSWDESVVSGAIANRFAISRPLLNLTGDQTTINQTSDILKLGGIEWKPVRCNSIKRLQKRMQVTDEIALSSGRRGGSRAAGNDRTDQRDSRKSFSPDCHFTEISRTCLAFSAMAADKNWMSVPVESNRAPIAKNSAASSGRVERPPTPTCLPYLRQAAIVCA
jgi:hypothetical protein